MKAVLALITVLLILSAGISRADEQTEFRTKLKSIVVEHIEFEEVSIKTVVDYLRNISKEADPDSKGINILLLLEKDKKPEDYRITLLLDKVPLDTVLDYTAKAAGLTYYTRGNVAVIAGKNVGRENMETRTYRVRPNVVRDVEGVEGAKADDSDVGFKKK